MSPTTKPKRFPTSSHNNLIRLTRRLIPPLSSERHKGQAGKVAIVGGSKDYCGAPYFASISCMRLGSDMSHTICQPTSSQVIKSYSPDLIVHPILDPELNESEREKELRSVLSRVQSVVLGPGLGREPFMMDCAKLCIRLCREMDIYLVVDADGLWLVQDQPEVILGYEKAVLTPNVVEFERLCKALDVKEEESLVMEGSNPKREERVKRLAKALGGPVILEKGKLDRITDGIEMLENDLRGGLKRCGGQGDILSGCLGTFLAWSEIYRRERIQGKGRGCGEEEKEEEDGGGLLKESELPLYSAFGASLVARTCSRLAFERLGRSMLAQDLLPEVGRAYEILFGEDPDVE
ncbi:hypothetical protein IE53DRAFT_367085 [Violaceomyces palustris]|uniref:Uncharacterized protein n=1 Tax=Violaceomyces palustris TaxID=1673888 RepID=A0ACD0P3D9_9BASI|nr:hypothetical protein IE53DRAFT_367085 [Violaceomyces palustris]